MNRTLTKGLVELGLTLAIAGLGWFANSAADLGLDPAFLALAVPVVLTLRRVLRDMAQGQPR